MNVKSPRVRCKKHSHKFKVGDVPYINTCPYCGSELMDIEMVQPEGILNIPFIHTEQILKKNGWDYLKIKYVEE